MSNTSDTSFGNWPPNCNARLRCMNLETSWDFSSGADTVGSSSDVPESAGNYICALKYREILRVEHHDRRCRDEISSLSSLGRCGSSPFCHALCIAWTTSLVGRSFYISLKSPALRITRLSKPASAHHPGVIQSGSVASRC
jgi:hypothetical protein